jgi:DNA-binding transcriptional LysR family regulator
VLLTNHVLSGAAIGGLTGRPLPAFAVGVASHFALDAVPHWGEWGSRRRFLRVAVSDGLIGLAAAGALVAVAPPERRLAVLAGIVGAALPDADKPTRLWFGRSPFPGPVNRFHDWIQDEAAGRLHVELLAAGALAAAALVALRPYPGSG